MIKEFFSQVFHEVNIETGSITFVPYKEGMPVPY